MVKKWFSFNESISSSELDEEILSDIFLALSEDYRVKVFIEKAVCYVGGNEWLSISSFELEEIGKVGWKIIIEKGHEDLSSLEDFKKYQSVLSEILSCCNRIKTYRNFSELNFNMNSYEITIGIKTIPTKKDACYVSYESLSTYKRECFEAIFHEDLYNGSSFSFEEEGGDYYIVIDYNGVYDINKEYDIEEMEERLEEFLEREMGKGCKFDKILKKENKIYIKNYIDNIIKFKYKNKK